MSPPLPLSSKDLPQCPFISLLSSAARGVQAPPRRPGLGPPLHPGPAQGGRDAAVDRADVSGKGEITAG